MTNDTEQTRPPVTKDEYDARVCAVNNTKAYLSPTEPVASIDRLAADTHEKWLASGDRRYSPFNAHWRDLSPEQRAQISRQARNAIDQLRAIGFDIAFNDEYAQPGPGDMRWSDPVRN